MLEIYNHTKITLPTTLESTLDFALQVALDCVLEGALNDLSSVANEIKSMREKSHSKEHVHIEIMFVGSTKMREFNRGFLGKDYATDVLSFPLENTTMPNFRAKSSKKVESSSLDFIDFLGAIVINLPLAKQNSKKFKHSLEEEIIILFIHAVLHLLGFDHESDGGEHRDKEREIMAKIGFEAGLSQNLQSLIFRANSPCK